MKVCDSCGQTDGKHTEVGPVQTNVQIAGYHHRHHSHPEAPWQWTLDLCPNCAKTLKYEIDALMKSFKEQ